MDQKPKTIETGKPRRRWFQFGEPWGLLARTNPTASWTSVARRAIEGALFGPAAYGPLIYFRGSPTEYIAIKLAVCSLLFALIAGIVEWQMNDDDI